ncbi:MAG: SCO family protein [Chloroflexi bacterium]|nr:SCO family protein [Chloroflexota bacterium]
MVDVVQAKNFGKRSWLAGLISLGVVLLVIIFISRSSPPEEFLGTELTSASPATPFELTDQFGQTVSLSDYKGKVTLLTFLYTNCPDVCPVVTSQLRTAREMLGSIADEVAFVAISLDPERDSVEAARAFSDSWDMTGKWAFLVGDEEELSPIWKAYYVDPAINAQSHDDEDAHAEGASEHQFLVIHSTPVYLIDREGIMRVVSTPPLDIDSLVHDIKLLVN